MAAREILPGTTIAATCQDPTSEAIRVYVQDAFGGIREFKHNNGWTAGDAYHVKFQAKHQSPIAVMEWYEKETRRTRMYTLSKDNTILESCCDNSDGVYHAGTLGACGFKAAPFSQLATIKWNKHPRVFYQGDNDAIQQLSYGPNGWSHDSMPTFPVRPLSGTSITAVGWGEDNMRVYYQGEDYRIWEAIYENGWSLNDPCFSAKPYSSLAAVTWLDNRNRRQIRFYCLDEESRLQEFCTNGGAWYPGDFTKFNIQAAPYSKVSAIFWNWKMRVYFQPANHNIVQEWGNNIGSGWWQGQVISASVPDGKPIDTTGATYAVGWMPCILDVKSNRSYDPSDIDGVGILIGAFDGLLVGENLKTKQPTVLKANTDGNSYAWVYTPGGAIFYRFWDHDHKRDYARHDHLGSGQPVSCAGEFRIAKDGQMESVLLTVHNSNRNYRPNGSQGLGPVATKMQNLGISLSQTSWYWLS